ncbi:MAG: hypothetical protein R2792_19955 [Saprospiraceae bacterium]
MKKIFAPACLIALLVVASCNKDTGFPPLPPKGDTGDTVNVDTPVVEDTLSLGEARMKINGNYWSGNFSIYRSRWDSLVFDVYGDYLSPTLRGEGLFVEGIPVSVGRHKVEAWNYPISNENSIPDGIFYITQDYDQPVGDYVIDSSGIESYIEITQYNPTSRQAKGKFQLYMHKVSGSFGWNPMPPNYLNITEGAFYFHLDY